MQHVNGCVDDMLLNAMPSSKHLADAVIKYDISGTQKKKYYAKIKICQRKSVLAYHPNPKLTSIVALSFFMNEKLYS